jgi:hypothetical protein
LDQKISKAKKGQLIADRIEGMSYKKLAAKYGISERYVRIIIDSDPEFAAKCKAKKEQDVLTVLSFMDGKKHDVCFIIDSLLGALSNPQKIQSAPLDKIAVALGIVIDKFTAQEASLGDMAKENNLFAALDKAVESVNLNGIQEIQ